MTRLEQRYRHLLRLLPGWYRAEREQEMVDVFLALRGDRDIGELDAEYGWPGWGESASVAALAVRTRVGVPGDPLGPRAVGDAVRVAALGAVLLCAAAALGGLGWRVVVAALDVPGARDTLDGLLHPSAGSWWPTVALVLGLCWLPAWTALATGHRRAALALAAAATLPAVESVVTTALDPSPGLTGAVSLLAGNLIALLAVPLLLAGFPRDAPDPSVRRPWTLLGVTTALQATGALLLLLLLVSDAIVPHAVVLLVAAVVLAHRGRATAGGIVVLAAAAAVGAAILLATPGLAASGPVIALALALAAILVAALRVRRRQQRELRQSGALLDQ